MSLILSMNCATASTENCRILRNEVFRKLPLRNYQKYGGVQVTQDEAGCIACMADMRNSC